jgi:hypothetical protein
MWGIFVVGLRYAAERRQQLADQQSAALALETA